MGEVVIEGSLTPSTHLPRGRRARVLRTPFVDALLAGGYATVVEEADGAAQPAPRPPRRNASRAAWAAFMAELGVQAPDEATRADLVAAWERVAAGG